MISKPPVKFAPSTAGEVETIPQEEISPLFMVQRVKRLKAVEWYYKDILTKLGLGKDKEVCLKPSY